MDKLEKDIYLLALKNAVKYNGKCNPNAIIGSVIKQHPDKKKDMEKLQAKIQEVVDKVNKLSVVDQEKELIKIEPEPEKPKIQEKADKDVHREYSEGFPEKVQTMKQIAEQNTEIAKGLVAVSDMVEGHEDKLAEIQKAQEDIKKGMEAKEEMPSLGAEFPPVELPSLEKEEKKGIFHFKK